jgi:hypothetical protein
MSDLEEPIGSRTTRRRSVVDVVERSDRGFAYVPGEVLVRSHAVRRLRELTRTETERDEDEAREEENPEEFEDFLAGLFPLIASREGVRGGRGWRRASDVNRVLEVVEVLVSEGYDAQPNHVMFVHGCGSPCPPHPALVHALVRSGLLANPMGANPMGANPMGANPMGANPMGANPMGANPLENTAVPAQGRSFAPRTLEGPGPTPTVVVLDTGLAGGSNSTAATTSVAAANHRSQFIAAADIVGLPADRDLPDAGIDLRSGLPEPQDNYLDPAAGHGTFVAGIIEQLAPGCHIDVRRVIGPLGDADEDIVADAIYKVVEDLVDDRTLSSPVILNLSFGGQAPSPPTYLREAVACAVNAGIAVIASAGNDGVCTPQYPAAFPGVIAVAAVGPDGPPPWTNYGDWVDACAPGVDLVSAFFDNWNGAFPTMNTFDPDRFTGWARWSGTSFAVPVVVAAVARELVCGRGPENSHLDAATAVERVVRAPHLARLPCLGTVVNI